MKKVILFLSALLMCLSSMAQSPDLEKVKATVKTEDIKSHIFYLASDELKGREVGTPGIDKAAEYIAAEFKKHGVKPVPGADNGYFQEVVLKQTSLPGKVKVSVEEENFANQQIAIFHGENIEKDARAIYLNYGMSDDYEGVEVKGKIILAKAGAPDQVDQGSLFKLSLQKRGLAQAAGAVALIEIHDYDEQYWNSVKGYLSHNKMALMDKKEPAGGPVHLWVNTDKDIFQNKRKGEELSTKLLIKGINNDRLMSRNVVGIVEGTDPELKNEYIIYSAHYDHVGVGKPNAEMDSIYNGARDNAVGVVTVLSAAENIAKYPTKRSALFILFTAEEKGLLGSKWYVDHPLVPLEQSVYCFNSDNASYNDTTKATIVGLERTTAAQNIKDACAEAGLKAIDDPAPEQNLFDRSDNVHFAAKGIPAPTFSLGFTSFDAELFKYYHQVTDNPETLDYDYLLKFFRAYVLSCRRIANDGNTPVWVEGDKYYEAGQNLYKEQ
ncbi:M28 family peptidase [Fulvivirga sp. 29W222]|uniref:M28 family peptidase n=1 Tax=Fulvivirga marina TaxID=2494733 RepID=A0A937FTW8_9BACT|nr:M28 family peptidase [Fulvivirga marina]MBL6444742.1 M28 family peptidase [Fulvivirga marina]